MTTNLRAASVQSKAHYVLFAVLHQLGFDPQVGRDAVLQRALRFFLVFRVNEKDDADFVGFHGPRQRLWPLPSVGCVFHDRYLDTRPSVAAFRAGLNRTVVLFPRVSLNPFVLTRGSVRGRVRDTVRDKSGPVRGSWPG